MDQVTLDSSLINILISNLKSSDFREIAIEQLLKLKEELTRLVPKMKKSISHDHSHMSGKKRTIDWLKLFSNLIANANMIKRLSISTIT